MESKLLIDEMAEAARSNLYEGASGTWDALPKAQRKAWRSAVLAALDVLSHHRPATSGVIRMLREDIKD